MKNNLKKKKILNNLLLEYDNGNKDVFFCLAVNLLNVDDLNILLKESDELTSNMSLDEKSLFMKKKLISHGEKRNIELKLRE